MSEDRPCMTPWGGAGRACLQNRVIPTATVKHLLHKQVVRVVLCMGPREQRVIEHAHDNRAGAVNQPTSLTIPSTSET